MPVAPPSPETGPAETRTAETQPAAHQPAAPQTAAHPSPASTSPARPPVALSIAGTDPSGGAGIHADLKTFTARGVYGTTVITALVAQNTHGVSRVHPIDTDFVADQFDAVLDDIPVDATKTGMLGTRALVELTVERASRGDLGFLTVDPVMVATSGHRLLEQDAVGAVRDLLAPVADLITPNLPEAALLLGDDVSPAEDLDRQREQARELVHRGSRAVLLKGGHGLGDVVVDVLAVRAGDGVRLREFQHPRIDSPHTHGTGCTLSAAITAEVATAVRAGRDPGDADTLAEVVVTALDYLARAIRSGARWQLSRDPDGAHGPVDHLVDLTGGAR